DESQRLVHRTCFLAVRGGTGAAETDRGGRRRGVDGADLGEDVDGIGPGTAGDRAPGLRSVAQPLLGVAGHVVRPECAQTERVRTDGHRAAAVEVRAVGRGIAWADVPPRQLDAVAAGDLAITRGLLPLEQGR